ncbi:hypothetical protein pb186bvf_019389 [Paramecium bursaria]
MQNMGCGDSVNSRGAIYILYGTTSGNSSRLAYQFADEVAKVLFIPKVVNLSEFNPALLKDQLCVFIVSTYGVGGPSDDSKEFFAWMMSEDRQKSELIGTKYLVFALGNTNHQHFCGMGEKVNDRLQFMGAKRIREIGRANAANDTTEQDYNNWISSGVVDLLSKEVEIKQLPAQDVQKLASLYQIIEGKGEPRQNLQFHAQKYVDSTLFEIEDIQELRKNSSRGNSTLFISLKSQGQYKAAQNIAIYPENSDHFIQLIANQLGLDLNYSFNFVNEGKIPFPTPITVYDYLKKFCDFLGPVTKKQLYELSKLTEDLQQQKELEFASSHQGKDEFRDKFKNTKQNFLYLLQKYKIRNLTLNQLIELCPLIAPRFYTIASSPLKHQNIHLLVSQLIVDENRIGLTSDYLRIQKVGNKLRGYIQDSSFVYPKNPQAPIVLIGPGTGLAPMRAFIQERDEYIERDKLDQSPFQGQMTLYFGCRNQDDFIFENELKEYKENGTLHQLLVAFSRIGDKKHVTDLFAQDLLQLSQFMDLGGVIYVCGSAAMVGQKGSTIFGLQKGTRI